MRVEPGQTVTKSNYPLMSKIAQRVSILPKIDNCRSMLYIENLMELVRLMIENEERGTFFPAKQGIQQHIRND